MIALAWVHLRLLLQSPAVMSRLVSVRTEELAGPALEWAISAIEGARASWISSPCPTPSA